MTPERRRRAPRLTARGETIRESLRRELRAEPATAHDLSRAVGIPEHDVADHLEHLARSLRRSGERLDVEASQCLDCGYVFADRKRLTRPGRCPECRSPRITLPVFRIVPR